MSGSETEIQGELASLSYVSPSGNFGVGALTNKTVVVGTIAHAIPGQFLILEGIWVEHPKFGTQFKASRCVIEDPQTEQGLLRYLAKGNFKGVGPAMAQKIVNTFGLATIGILSNRPEELLSISGLGPKTLTNITDNWQRDQARHSARIEMSGLGIGLGLIETMEACYGTEALTVIKEDPYRLCREVQGIGFVTADRIAMAQGLAIDSPKRAEAAVRFSMLEIEGNGHCFATYGDLFAMGEKLSIPIGCMDAAIQRLNKSELKNATPSTIHRKATLNAEKRVAAALLKKNRMQTNKGLFGRNPLTAQSIEGKLDMRLNNAQIEAVESTLTAGLTVITGGPGTGKTTIVKAALLIAQQKGESWALAAPTGRAAKRMSEATGATATTIHRLLKYNGKKRMFTHHEQNKIEADTILIDEASMLDIWLMDALLKAIPSESRLVLIGDSDQLPSVGPGQILGDLIAAKKAKINPLSKVYRQALDSNIVLNAHRIRTGKMPISVEKDPQASLKKDFYLIERTGADACLSTLLEIVTHRLVRLGFSARKDLQVLSPMRGGELGVEKLNEALQKALNPSKKEGIRGFRIGDRVMQTKNDHDNMIYNGDIGKISQITEEGIEIEIDGRFLLRNRAETTDLELAYATTIHKSQGSEYPAMILVLSKSQSIMLRRNLIYTAVTRAKRFCCIIDDQGAVEIGLSKADMRNRQTLLYSLLSGKEPIDDGSDLPHNS